MRIPLLFVVVAVAGCGAAQSPEARPASGDQVVQDQSTTGGQPVTYMPVPSFDVIEEQTEHQHYVELVSARDRSAARHDRQSAAQLAFTESSACRDMPEREREHSVFAHRKSIASVEPVRENGQLHGVRIVFRPVRGLSAKFIERDIACTRTRWVAFGRDPTLTPNDPTLVDGADVQVFDRDGHVEVVVSTASQDAAEVALARANHQLTAER